MSSKLTKSEKTKSKFTQLNINHVYKGNTSETHHKPAVRQYGMQVVGKLQGTRRLPPPAWVPSLKAETGGLDPRVSIVPAGGSGWGTPYAGVNSNEADPAQANNELSPSPDSLANSGAYTSMNGALVREAIGTSFEPAFARQNFAYVAKVNTESNTGASEEAMVSTVTKVMSDTLQAVDSQVAVSTATSDAQLPASSLRSQSTAASGGLAANVPFFQRPTPVVTTSSTTPSKTSVDSVAASDSPACSKATHNKVTDWASAPDWEEPNYNEKLIFSDEEDVQKDPRDAITDNQATGIRESTQEEVGQGGTTSATISTGASTWASSVRSGSTVTDHSGLVPDSILFPNVPDTWQASDPTTLVESLHCSSLPGHLPFVPPPASIAGASLNHDTSVCVPLDVHYLSGASSAHVQPSYKDPYFQQTISSRLMETSISNRMPETGFVTGDSEVELQNFQRQARTKEFKSAVERAQQARNARQKSDVFLSDQTGHQALHPCGVNVSDPSVGLKYCQPVSVVPREAGPSVESVLNNSVTTPHVLLSAYRQAAHAAAMAFSSGSSAPPRFPFSHMVAPTTGSNTSTTSCTGANSQWSGPINPNITSGTNLSGLLNSRAQYGRLDNFSSGSGSASQMSTPASHPPAILLNPEFFVERFWEILNQQQQASHSSQQSTDKTILEGGSEIPQPPNTTVSADILANSQHQYGSKCNGSSILGEYGFRADHFARACIEDSSPHAEANLKATRFITPSPDAEPLSTTISDTVNIRTQSDSDKSSSKLSKRVPGLMDVKVPKSTACNLAHLWDQDDYLAPGPRANGCRGRGRQTITDRGRGLASRRRGTFRPGTVDTKPAESGATTQAHFAQTSCTPHTSVVDYLENQEGDGEVKQQDGVGETKTEQVHTDASDSVGCNEDADDPRNTVDTKSVAGAASTRRGSTKKRAGDVPGDTRLVDGSRRFRGRGDSQHYLHDSGHNYYDGYGGSGGRAAHRAVSRGSSSHFTSHRSFSNRDAAGGGYSTRYIRQLGGGSFSSRDYRQHTPASADQHTVSKSGPTSQGYRDNQRTLGDEPFSDQLRRPFTNQRKQPRGNCTAPGATDYHFSDSEEPHYRKSRDLHYPASVPPRNRSHDGPSCDSSNADRRRTPTGDADESTKSRLPVTSKDTKSATKDTHEDDTDIPTVRVPAPDTLLMNTYRQQYPFSRSGGFRSSAYHRRGGKTGANGPRSTGRTNAPTQSSSTRQAGTTGGLTSSRRYRELRDRHRDDGRDGDGGGASAGGGGASRSGTISGGTGTTSGGSGQSGHTVSGGGVGGPRDDNCQPDGDDVGNSNENNAQWEQNLHQSASDRWESSDANETVDEEWETASEGGTSIEVLKHVPSDERYRTLKVSHTFESIGADGQREASFGELITGDCIGTTATTTAAGFTTTLDKVQCLIHSPLDDATSYGDSTEGCQVSVQVEQQQQPNDDDDDDDRRRVGCVGGGGGGIGFGPSAAGRRKGYSGDTSDKAELTAGNRSVRSSNHSTSEGGGGYHRVHRQQQRHRFHLLEMTGNYRQVYSPQKRTHTNRSQNIPPLMSIEPTGPFARNPDHFDAVLDLGCCRSSNTEVKPATESPQMDISSLKSDVSSSGREPTDQEEAVNGDNGRAGADDCDDDGVNFLSDGFTEVISKSRKRLARLRLQQEAAVAATTTSAPLSGRHPGELRKQSSNTPSSQTCGRPTTNQHHHEQRTGAVSQAANPARNAKKKSTLESATASAKYTTQRSGKLPSIKATFMGPPLSSLVSDAASSFGAEQQRRGAGSGDHPISGAPVQASDSSFSVWASHNRHQHRHQSVATTTAAAMAQEPRTWSKVVGTKSSSGSSATLSTELKQPSIASDKSGSGGVSSSSLPRNDGSCETAAGRAPSLMQEKNSSTPSSCRSDGSDGAEAQKADRAEKSMLLADTDKRQVCTVSATSVHPSVSCTTVVSSPKSSSDALSAVPRPSVSQSSCVSLSTAAASPSPVVVVVPVSSNNICKVRPQQQQQRSPTHAGVPVTSTGSHHHPQTSTTAAATNSVANANAAGGCGESGVVIGMAVPTPLVPADATCHDMDREYVDLALSVVGSGGGGGNPSGTLHEQPPLHPGWSIDAGGGNVPSAVTNSSTYYEKFTGSQQSSVMEQSGGIVARSFWPISEQAVHLGGDPPGGQSYNRGEVSNQFKVHPPDHPAMGLLPNDFAGNKGSGLQSALHGLYPLQVNFTGQSLPATAMESYTSGTAAYASGTASSFNDFTCKMPPSHVGSPTQQQQQHPTLGNSSIYIAPSLLHSSVTMGGASQQAHSSYPNTTTNWTALSMNHAHPSQQALLHSRQQRLRHRPTPNNAVDSPAPFSGFPYHPDAQNDYAFLQSGIQSAPNSGLYSSVPTHPHSVYVPPNSRSWSLLGAPTASGGAGVGSVIRSQDYHPGISGMTGASFAGASGAGVGGNSSAAGGGAVGLLPHPIPSAVGSGRASTDYATQYVGQPSSAVVSSSTNVVFSAASSLVNHNYVGVIGGGRPVATSGATSAEFGGRADQLALSLRHRAAAGGGGQHQGLFQHLHTAGGGGSAGAIAGLAAESSLSSSAATHHSNQLAAAQQQFPVHSTFYTSSSHHQQQQQQRLQQQLSQFAVGNQSAVARAAAAAVNSVTHPHHHHHHHHHGLVGGPPGATGLYATFGTPPPPAPAPGGPNQPTPPPLSAHPGPAQLAPTALRHGMEGWQWWA